MGIKAARSILDDTISVHQIHLDHPETATRESQIEMMVMIKAARAALEVEDEEDSDDDDHMPGEMYKEILTEDWR